MFEMDELNGILEVRACGVVRASDAELLEERIRRYMEKRRSGRFLCDARELQIYAPDAADRVVEAMRNVNPSLARAAWVVTPGTTAALQMARMIKLAGSDRRRIFSSREEAVAWLQEITPLPVRI